MAPKSQKANLAQDEKVCQKPLPLQSGSASPGKRATPLQPRARRVWENPVEDAPVPSPPTSPSLAQPRRPRTPLRVADELSGLQRAATPTVGVATTWVNDGGDLWMSQASCTGAKGICGLAASGGSNHLGISNASTAVPRARDTLMSLADSAGGASVAANSEISAVSGSPVGFRYKSAEETRKAIASDRRRSLWVANRLEEARVQKPSEPTTGRWSDSRVDNEASAQVMDNDLRTLSDADAAFRTKLHHGTSGVKINTHKHRSEGKEMAHDSHAGEASGHHHHHHKSRHQAAHPHPPQAPPAGANMGARKTMVGGITPQQRANLLKAVKKTEEAPRRAPGALFRRAVDATIQSRNLVLSNKARGASLQRNLNREDHSVNVELPVADRLEHVARTSCIPLDIVKQAFEVFEGLVRRKQKLFAVTAMTSDGMMEFDTLNEGKMKKAQFAKVLAELRGLASDVELPGDVLDVCFRCADRHQQGFLCFRDFVAWYSMNSFTETMLLTEEQQEVRGIARMMGLDIVEVEEYKKSFDDYDEDKNGSIEPVEFQKLLNKLARVPADLELPAARVQQFFHDTDADGSGAIGFHEFLAFYVKYFGTKDQRLQGRAQCPFEEYYRGVRAVPITSSRYWSPGNDEVNRLTPRVQ